MNQERNHQVDRGVPSMPGVRPLTSVDLNCIQQIQQRNRLVGWTSMALGAATGLILGLWSFNGPVAVPNWLGGYAETSRRLARLGHIAFFGLGIINLLLAHELPRFALGLRAKRAAAVTMNLGNIFLPLTLFAASFYQPLKYLMPWPALCVFTALVLAAYGSRPGRETHVLCA